MHHAYLLHPVVPAFLCFYYGFVFDSCFGYDYGAYLLHPCHSPIPACAHAHDRGYDHAEEIEIVNVNVIVIVIAPFPCHQLVVVHESRMVEVDPCRSRVRLMEAGQPSCVAHSWVVGRHVRKEEYEALVPYQDLVQSEVRLEVVVA